MTLDLFQKEEQHINDPVTVLGKTFANDEERRAFFCEELRQKLPELKEIEGFPIGEDEDIIKLSDPPFYTACPNPWINDFIAEWEEEKKKLEKQGKRMPDFQVTEPYATDVSEGKNNPIYMAHSYHTKVPHPAIMRYIMHYTQPGDVIFDGFAGTGMTGVASSMCANPDADFKIKIEKENHKVQWGKRNTICNDLSPIASLISYFYNYKLTQLSSSPDFIEDVKLLKKEYGWLYETIHTKEEIGLINYVIWSDVLICSNCNNEIIFYESAIDENKGIVNENFKCPSCNSEQTKKSTKLSFESKYDNIRNKVKKEIKRKPVLINYTYKNKRYSKTPDATDLNLFKYIEEFTIDNFVPLNEIFKGDEIGRLLNLNIETIKDLFFKRSLIILSALNKLSERNNSLRILLSAIIQNSSLLYRWRSSGKGGTTSGTYYVCSTPQENNVFNVIDRKIQDFEKVIKLLNDDFNITSNNSATDNLITNNSIDYIFTDPPFGANIMYSELNLIWESWLKVWTNNTKEAIENKYQNKSILNYQNLMFNCFQEYYRILKPGKWMTVEFSNTSASVWNGIQTALVNTGFIIANIAALDKKQGSFKAVTSTTAVKQDLVISCYKPSSEFDTKFKQSQHSPMGVWDFVEEHLEHLPIHIVKDNATTAVVERNAKILFDRLIAFYVQRSLPVPIDAGKFQEGLKEHFIERDSMYFTQEQVEEYERKKAEVPEFIQMSLFVGSEQDAVYWLRQLLDKEPKAEQDLHPLWMREVAGNMRKGDTLPEMRQILEENFLKTELGKWYVPDAENEADLEKLRNKRLIKIFEEYKTIAASPKGKIKEVRVEALRAGFKQCYQDKDFKTIVTIGDRIPNNLLMEDEVLLQFYDIASAKI
ncbi:DNA methyltransferase [Myroides odoratus]|uniref:DNA methyltransferase n=1 Tax=Myroides odoratus TaxID=256 RepID=UPI003341CD6C